MNRDDIIERLKTVEPVLRARGVGGLYLFGSYSRDEATSASDIDVFVEAAQESFYDLSNYMAAYEDLVETFPGTRIGYSTRDGLSRSIRDSVERDAIRIF